MYYNIVVCARGRRRKGSIGGIEFDLKLSKIATKGGHTICCVESSDFSRAPLTKDQVRYVCCKLYAVVNSKIVILSHEIS
jgi:hypothetical protein